MILEIRKYPDSVLRQKAAKIEEITPEIKELALNMIETMKKNEGVGLAANQVGVLKRIIVVQTKEGPQVFINPKIIKKSKEMEMEEEGCLSFPGLFLKIKRAKSVEILYSDESGQEFHLQAIGLSARIIQHEIDHLDGILIRDKISLWKKLKITLGS